MSTTSITNNNVNEINKYDEIFVIIHETPGSKLFSCSQQL